MEYEREVAAAYMDMGPSYDGPIDRHPLFGRCTSFLMSGWVDGERAIGLAEIIGGYNDFSPETVESLVGDIHDVDPDAQFAFGREGSVVIYIETDTPYRVANTSREDGETVEVPPRCHIGSIRVNEFFGRESHVTCEHEEPVVPDDKIAPIDDDKGYVRVFWD